MKVKFDLIGHQKQCNCLSSGSDGENRDALSTMRARQFCTLWSSAKSLSNVV